MREFIKENMVWERGDGYSSYRVQIPHPTEQNQFYWWITIGHLNPLSFFYNFSHMCTCLKSNNLLHWSWKEIINISGDYVMPI